MLQTSLQIVHSCVYYLFLKLVKSVPSMYTSEVAWKLVNRIWRQPETVWSSAFSNKKANYKVSF